MRTVRNGGDHAQQPGQPLSLVDGVLLLAALALTQVGEAVTSPGSPARYAICGAAALAFVKGGVGMIASERPTQPERPLWRDSFGQL